MEAILGNFGLTMGEFYNLVYLGGGLLVALLLLRFAFRLTARLVRLGCGFILLALVGLLAISLLN